VHSCEALLAGAIEFRLRVDVLVGVLLVAQRGLDALLVGGVRHAERSDVPALPCVHVDVALRTVKSMRIDAADAPETALRIRETRPHMREERVMEFVLMNLLPHAVLHRERIHQDVVITANILERLDTLVVLALAKTTERRSRLSVARKLDGVDAIAVDISVSHMVRHLRD
jgi:hypothetical protein